MQLMGSGKSSPPARCGRRRKRFWGFVIVLFALVGAVTGLGICIMEGAQIRQRLLQRLVQWYLQKLKIYSLVDASTSCAVINL